MEMVFPLASNRPTVKSSASYTIMLYAVRIRLVFISSVMATTPLRTISAVIASAPVALVSATLVAAVVVLIWPPNRLQDDRTR